ncbi:hypothetical protein G9A89_020588 [Geosiphon pyriformis]|nr:hypothetical protein G9A89_020588 [Geosiphon pyriformis]
MSEFDHFVQIWLTHDNAKTSKFIGLFQGGLRVSMLFVHLLMVKKNYQKSKYYEAKLVRNGHIKDEVKFQVDEIMVNWTCKKKISSVLLSLWACQYAPLEHVDGTAFLEVMNDIDLSELFLVVSELSNDKAGLSSISNKL